MKAIFYVLALLAIGAAAFFSFQNVGKFNDQRAVKVETQEKNAVLAGKKTKKQTELDAEILKRDEANREREAVKQSIQTLVSKGKQLAREIQTVNATITEQKAKLAELDKAKEKANEILKDAKVNSIEELPAEIEKLAAERKTKEKNLEELKTAIEALEKNVAQNQEEITRLAERDSSRDVRIRRNSMQATVSAVNEDWGFVIIGAGSNTGFTPQTKLLVRREGRLIAEVKPSSIEPSQTIAEIDPDTLAPGARIQPGDTVILAEPATN